MIPEKTGTPAETRQILLLFLIDKIQPLPDLALLHTLVFLADTLLAEHKLLGFRYEYVNQHTGPYSSVLTADLKELDMVHKWITYDDQGIRLTSRGKDACHRVDHCSVAGLAPTLEFLGYLLRKLRNGDEQFLASLIERMASQYVKSPLGHKLELAGV